MSCADDLRKGEWLRRRARMKRIRILYRGMVDFEFSHCSCPMFGCGKTPGCKIRRGPYRSLASGFRRCYQEFVDGLDPVVGLVRDDEMDRPWSFWRNMSPGAAVIRQFGTVIGTVQPSPVREAVLARSHVACITSPRIRGWRYDVPVRDHLPGTLVNAARAHIGILKAAYADLSTVEA